MNWLYKTFFPFCIEHGLDIQADDKRQICLMLCKVPLNERQRVMGVFYKKWHEGMGAAFCASQRQAMGRKYAYEYLDSEFKGLP